MRTRTVLFSIVSVLITTLTCPQCGHHAVETMPTNACVHFYECSACRAVLRPKSGDCCVFCSYGSSRCPPRQHEGVIPRKLEIRLRNSIPISKLGFPLTVIREMLRNVPSLLAVSVVFLCLSALPVVAQESFEIAVYPYATAHVGEWEFEGHFNYASRGTTAFDGTVAPRQGQVRFAGEVTRGITQNWEMSGYVLAAQVPDFGVRYAGWRLRSRFSAPAEWRLPVNLGLSLRDPCSVKAPARSN